jgi:hypothetical protein
MADKPAGRPDPPPFTLPAFAGWPPAARSPAVPVPGYGDASSANQSNESAEGPSGEGVFDAGQTPVRTYWWENPQGRGR